MPTPSSKSSGVNFSPSIRINVYFLYTTFLGVTSWLIWPDSWRGYGLGMLSVILGLSAFFCLVGAVKTMIQRYLREKRIAEFEALGEKPRSSSLASNEDLDEAGMR